MTRTSDAGRPERQSVPDAALLDLVTQWLPGRRWFPAKGHDAAFTTVGGLTLVDPRGIAEVRILLIRAVSATIDVVLQVPLTLHAVRAGHGETGAGWIGTVGSPPVQVRDGAGDPAFVRAWLAAATSTGSEPAGLGIDPDHPHLISGEQSNTSVILPGTDGSAILKVFRALTPGDNPDVEVPARLSADGWWHVPRPLGWLEGNWSTGNQDAVGHLAVLSEFITDAEDGFELACEMAGRGEPFADLAHDLGAVMAGMHRALATSLPVAQPRHRDDDVAAGLASALAERFRWACLAVPELAGWSRAVHEQVELVRGRTAVPELQRVHGDLHLGQALRARGEWFIIDFEGEPLSSIAERTRPDLALRDVAGVLRSFDYAAAVSGAPLDWITSARSGLLRGYAAASSTDPDRELIRALEIDKALYEAVYEARNRPQWSYIPAAALERLLGRSDRSAG